MLRLILSLIKIGLINTKKYIGTILFLNSTGFYHLRKNIYIYHKLKSLKKITKYEKEEQLAIQDSESDNYG